MAQNSFQLKGWGVVLVVGLLALGGKEMERTMINVAYVPIFFFAVLDTSYLAFERYFRDIYDLVREGSERIKPFAMKLPDGITRQHYLKAICSWSTLGFWVPVAIAVRLAAFILLGG
jgi:hypothetical protein